MVSFSLFSAKALVTLACALSVSGLTIPSIRSDSEDKGPGFVKLDFAVTRSEANTTELQTRGDVDAPLNKEQTYYSIDIGFGTPAQVVGVVLDTGSSDLWIADSVLGPGGFDHTKSSTYQNSNEPFVIGYVSGSDRGTYVYDTVAIPNGPSLEHFQFGDVFTNFVHAKGILGIGYTGIEATSGQPKYPNFPEALKNAGFISKNAYSLYLNDVSATEGSIIFGGIDNAKYEGSLQSLPIQRPGKYLDVNLDSVTTPDGKTHQGTGNAILDSGTTNAFLPTLVLSGIAQSIGGIFNPFLGIVTLPPGASTEGDLQFTFGGKQISVPLANLITNIGLGSTFNIQSTIRSLGQVLIGDIILRSAYVVYDLDDNTIQIAQAKYTDASSIVPIN